MRRLLLRRRRRGVVLILTLFVLLITYALIAQLTLGTEVAGTATRNAANQIRMEQACTSAAQQILDTLRDDQASGQGGAGGLGGNSFANGGDLTGSQSGDLGGGGGGSGGGGSGGGGNRGASAGSGQDSGGGGGGDGSGADGQQQDDGSNSDSWEDTWAKPMRVQMDDVVITAWVEDENAKFNLLQLVAEDDDYREEARERCARILDYLREDMDGDLDASEARVITEEISEWLEGRTRSKEYPRPERYSNPEDEDRTLMSSLDELLLLEHVTPQLYYDQLVNEDRIAPGLESVFTIWTSVALDTPSQPAAAGASGDAASSGNENQGAGGDQGGAAQGGGNALSGQVSTSSLSFQSGGAQQSSGSGAGGAQSGGGGAQQPGGAGAGGAGTGSGSGGSSQMVGVKLNINTMPRAVLQGLMPSDQLSTAAVNEILEYRNKVDEEALAKQREEEGEPEERSLREALYGDREPEPKLYFKSTGDLDKIETLKDRTEQEARNKFMQLVGVQSDVFSVYLFARIPPRDWRQETRYQEPPGPALRMRAVVWRRAGQNGAEFVYLQNWQPVPYTRQRIPDYQNELPPFRAPQY